MTTELRIRTKIQEAELLEKVGKIVTDADYDVLLTRATRVLKPDGSLLCIYQPAAFDPELMASFYDVLHSLRVYETDNRGLASGTQRFIRPGRGRTRSASMPVASTIIGNFDAKPPKQYCRLTAWTGRNWDEFASLFPLFRAIGQRFAEAVPDRYAVQMAQVAQTPEEWVIEGTPFTTITVNNTYPTGVHTDKGDLAAGFSNVTVLRRGSYTGGLLTFPEYRVAADLHDGDLLLMDAHEWHGNTAIVKQDPTCWWCAEAATHHVRMVPPDRHDARWGDYPACASHTTQPPGPVLAVLPVVPAERISIVCYYRAKMKDCGTAEQEIARAQDWAEHRAGIMEQSVVEEMAMEAAQVANG